MTCLGQVSRKHKRAVEGDINIDPAVSYQIRQYWNSATSVIRDGVAGPNHETLLEYLISSASTSCSTSYRLFLLLDPRLALLPPLREVE